MALRHRVLIERMEQIDAAILDMAEAVGELAAPSAASTCPGLPLPRGRRRPGSGPMTASLHRLGAGAEAGCITPTTASARPGRTGATSTTWRMAAGCGGSSGDSVVRHGAAIDAASFRDLCAASIPPPASRWCVVPARATGPARTAP